MLVELLLSLLESLSERVPEDELPCPDDEPPLELLLLFDAELQLEPLESLL